MYIKKQKELKTFLPTFIISFCRFNIRILSFGQFFSCASTILSFSELWRHFVWSCDHNPVFVILITGCIVITIRRMQFKLLCSVSPASHYHTVIIGFPSIRGGRCHKKVSKISSMTYIWFHGAYCHLTDVTMCYQVTKWHVFSQSCDNLDMTRDFHPSLAKLSPQSLLKHPWTKKKERPPIS